MTPFNSYLTEIFDTHYPWRLVSSGSCAYGECWDYQFDCVKLRGSDRWIPEIDLDIPIGRPVSTAQVDAALQKRQQQYAGERQRVVVSFTRKMGSAAFREWSHMSKTLDRSGKELLLSDWEQIWELGFGTYIDSDGSGYDAGTDEDIGGGDRGHVNRIFGTIIQIAQAFVTQKKPKGIMWGTKPGANPARAVIYGGIAKRLAGGMGAKLLALPSPRPSEMANCQTAWWGGKPLLHSVEKPKPSRAKQPKY